VRHSEARFRSMANATPAMIWTADPGGRITFHNRRWLEYTGLSAEENVVDWPRVLHPDDVERCTRAWAHALEHGTEYEVEVRNRSRHGDYRWFLTRATPVRDAQGRIVEWYGSTTEIHDRKQAEEALRASELRFRSIFETAAVSIWEEDFSGVHAAIHELRAQGVTDFRRYFTAHPESVERMMALVRVLDVNDATVKMFQATDRYELVGPLPRVFGAESVHVFVDELTAIAEGRGYFEGEAPLTTLRGNRIQVYFSVVFSDATHRALVSVFDITIASVWRKSC